MSNTQRWVSPNILQNLKACENGTCLHFRWIGYERVRDLKLCLHFASIKSLTRDRRPYQNKSNHKFKNGLHNSLENIIKKNNELSLLEALETEHTPRYRHNHSRPYDNIKEWSRMIKHDDSLRWQRPRCPNNYNHSVFCCFDNTGYEWRCHNCDGIPLITKKNK